MYQWICEKCGDENRSSSNICKNTACRTVFHGYVDQKVRCGRCGREPVGNSLYRKGRNTTFPLRTLTSSALYAEEYKVFGEPVQKYLRSLTLLIGAPLCQVCHPSNLWMKFPGDLSGAEEANPEFPVHLDLSQEEKERRTKEIQDRITENEKAYGKIANHIKERLVEIRKEDPEITGEEEMRIARKLISRVQDDEFITDQIDLELRRIIRGAIASRISFRKNIPKDRIYEKLYKSWKVKEAMTPADEAYLRRSLHRVPSKFASKEPFRISRLSHQLRRALKREAQRVTENGEQLISDARKGPDLFWAITKITELMAKKSDEIALKEHRLREESETAFRLDARMTLLFNRIKRMEAAVTASNDPDYLSRILPILTRTRNRYSYAAEQAQRFLTPLEIERERFVVATMQRKFFTHYAPLLHSARKIILWDIKKDLWNGGHFEGSKYLDKVTFFPNGKRGPAKVLPAINFTRKPVNEITSTTCDVCRQETLIGQMVNGVYVVPVEAHGPIESQVGRVQLSSGDIYDVVPEKKIPLDQRKLYKRISLFMCSGCRESGDYLNRLLEIEKRLKERRMEELEKGKVNQDLRDATVSNLERTLANLKIFTNQVAEKTRVKMAEMGVLYSASIPAVDPKTFHCMVKVIAVSMEELPKEMEVDGTPIKVIQVPGVMFGAAYLYHYLPEKEIGRWKKVAADKGWKLSERGLLRMEKSFGSRMDPGSIASALGTRLPEFPVQYWKGQAAFQGSTAIHPNLRDVIHELSDTCYEPLAVHSPSMALSERLRTILSGIDTKDDDLRMMKIRTEVQYIRSVEESETVEHRKELEKSIQVRRTEEAKANDWLRRRKGRGPSPKPKSKKIIKTKGFFNPKETPMDPSRGIFMPVRPEDKDLTDFLMAAPPSSGDKGTRHFCTVAEEKEFYAKKTSEYIADKDNAKKMKEKSDKLFKKTDPKTFQRIKRKK